MKKLLLPDLAPARPFRLWMTGSLAVVMAAMIPLREMAPGERNHALRVLRHSRFGVVETVQRIETAALARGLAVLAMTRGAQPVLVLASSIGGTPVLMQHADSLPTMPLSLFVRAGLGEGADICLLAAADAATRDRWAELPAAVTDDLRSLPSLVDSALA